MPDLPTPAAALIGEDANSAVFIFREKNATSGVSHKVVANATISQIPLLHVQCLTGGTLELLQLLIVVLLRQALASVGY